MKKKFFFLVLSFFAVIFSVNAQGNFFDFDNLHLPDTGFWNGSDTTFYNGSFGDDYIIFINEYDENYGSWSGFAFSNWTDTVTEGWTNQWSTYAGEAYNGDIFGLAFIPIDYLTTGYPNIPIDLYFNSYIDLDSFKITNSTYTALEILQGLYSFSDGDYYKIIIYGMDDENYIDTTEVVLADYRQGNSFILDEWLNVEFSGFNNINHLRFDAYSTDAGDYGINTPLYFCLDDIRYHLITNNDEKAVDLVKIYPNPASNFISVSEKYDKLDIFDISGNLLKSSKNRVIDISDLNSGVYIVKIKTENSLKTSKFIKQ